MKVAKYLITILFALLLSCEKSLEPSHNTGWHLQYKFQDDITYYAIDFTDQKTGWAVGYSGTIQKTLDGGNSWSKQKSGVSSNLWDVCFIDINNGWISGANNTILKTINGGKSWNNISTGNDSGKIITSIIFIDNKNGWASSNKGEILKTNNGGTTWRVAKTFGSGGSKLAVFDENTVYCLHGNLYRTFDAGTTWDSQNIIDSKNYWYHNMSFVNKNCGYLPTNNGTGGSIITEFPVISTKDGGLTWQLSDSLKGYGFDCIFFVDERNGWLAGINNIYKTTNGGQTWVLDYSSNDTNPVRAKDIHFVDKTCGWTINYDGDIFKY
jgi:photosystem II stability/assembly factor-like uncharacterized protein